MKKTTLPLLGLSLLFVLSSCGEEEVEVVKISTKHGDMIVWLYDETPKHKENFLKLAREGYYDGTTFHRVIPGFMIQGGDPNSKDGNPATDGQGGPDYKIDAEFNENLRHRQGALAAARQGDQVNPERKSSGSQFYIVHPEQGTAQLDGAYTVFGDLIKGHDVVDKIANANRDQRDRPTDDITMEVEVITMTKAQIYEEHGFEPQIKPEK